LLPTSLIENTQSQVIPLSTILINENGQTQGMGCDMARFQYVLNGSVPAIILQIYPPDTDFNSGKEA
jgi:hypothetical protein